MRIVFMPSERYGSILLGIDDQGNVVGVEDIESEALRIENTEIDLVRFVGSNVSQILDHKTLKNMSLLEQFDQCMDYFEKHQLGGPPGSWKATSIYRLQCRGIQCGGTERLLPVFLLQKMKAYWKMLKQCKFQFVFTK